MLAYDMQRAAQQASAGNTSEDDAAQMAVAAAVAVAPFTLTVMPLIKGAMAAWSVGKWTYKVVRKLNKK